MSSANDDLSAFIQHFTTEGWEVARSGSDDAEFQKVTHGPGWALLVIPLWFITVPWFIAWFFYNRGQLQHLYIRVNEDGEISEQRRWRTPLQPPSPSE